MVNEIPVVVDGFTVIGVTGRTTNRAEADPQAATIPALWQRFFAAQDAIPHRLDANVIVGVYTRYESDHTGAYSLIVGTEVSAATDVPEGLVSVTVPAGRYLVFTAEGEMPSALIRTWIGIWEYFPSTKYQRAYTADFERHDRRRPSRVEVHVAIR